MLHLMIELALQEQYTLLFNLEMSVQQVQTRLLSNFSYRKSLIDNSKHKFSINELSSLKDILNLKMTITNLFMLMLMKLIIHQYN